MGMDRRPSMTNPMTDPNREQSEKEFNAWLESISFVDPVTGEIIPDDGTLPEDTSIGEEGDQEVE
jgi:photosystem II stability/assembly factor-like uncharacterized protein